MTVGAWLAVPQTPRRISKTIVPAINETRNRIGFPDSPGHGEPCPYGIFINHGIDRIPNFLDCLRCISECLFVLLDCG